MEMNQLSSASKKVTELYETLARRIGASAFGSCPVDLTSAFVRLCLAQSCGKCVPCRIGLDRLAGLLDRILSDEAESADLTRLQGLALSVYDSADCAIGFEAAKLVLDGLTAFRDDYVSHIEKGVCATSFGSVPCQKGCPAHVDIPGYIACVRANRADDAVRIIRRDNPFPGVCGLICEHPCERYCRRNVVDDAINIRGLKRYAVEKVGEMPAPRCAAPNGKKVSVIGGGPAGLTAAYYLSLNGYAVTVFERRGKLGGMLRYGIPSYRLPDADLDRDIGVILSTGMTVEHGVEIGRDRTLDDLRKTFDAVYVTIGAHGAKRLGIDGENAKGVLSAVELLGAVGDGDRPDFAGKRVVVIGGGNVAMDATRTARRLGAKSVTCVYRRRVVDMTALPDEVAGAAAEGCEIVQLMAPVGIMVQDDRVVGLVVKPQIVGAIRNGRPAPVDSAEPEQTIPCDIVIVAIGQDIASQHFAESGLAVKRGALVADATGEVKKGDGQLAVVFTGGDCCSGPATVIRAIDAGKVAAVNIDAALRGGAGGGLWRGDEVPIPDAPAGQRLNWGRVNMVERPAADRKDDFNLMEKCLTDEEAAQECSRCLRCDHYGRGCFRKE